ncbi:ATP-dependent DNA helicase [Gemmiger formicilis]
MQTYPTGYAQSHRMAEHIFRDILPQRGMAVREEQIALCHEILDTLYNKEISMCEAGVGIGKTLAYLVAYVLWQMNRPDRLKLPVVISTSSVALQDAIINDYLPNLSAILLEERIIQVPLTAVIRKGKERFVCDARLIERESQIPATRKRQRNSLHMAERTLDMDHIPELSRFDRNRICVPQSCPRDCFMRLDCRYQQYLRDSMKPDIQICNHNYLLADASHRLEDRPLLLRSYQALVVDEAHKLPDAARQMYTETLSPHNMDELCLLLQQAHYKDFDRQMRTAFLTLSFSCTQGLSKLRRKASEPFVLTPFRRAALIDCIALLQNAGGLPDVPRYLLNRLGEAESLLRLFLLEVPTRILYIDYDADGQPTFCAASSRVPQLLRSALWNTREPAILTSGTLAAAGDFSHTEQLLGLAAYRPLRHFRANSPFNYKKKCLLYFPPRVKMRMDNRKMAEEIVRLVGACHGHALVLFTSYRQMAEVRALTDGQWQYPTYQAWRNGGKIIQKFKESGNGVLFAAGSCWEGIDFSGDMVSLLIIARLPFPIPDPVSDYERQKYPNLQEYIAAEITPEMQKKLRQGFGRAIRTEQDSCVVAILDERAAPGAKYHNAALAALPDCQTTSKIEDVQHFIREQKHPDYFCEKGL